MPKAEVFSIAEHTPGVIRLPERAYQPFVRASHPREARFSAKWSCARQPVSFQAGGRRLCQAVDCS
jgi:hypothetical protein